MSMIGKSLAHYEITGQIGKGGMGEVYRAKDSKLGREVAIKVLPEEFAQDPDRVARFQREAKLLASLNHPKIAAIHGLENSDGTHFLVMELIEGDTLDNRIKTGSMPVEEALKLAIQITEALEAAHEKGVIHRDLKPSNVKITPEGKVKILDFGLAKAYAGEVAVGELSNSPTLSDAATRQGVILGTAAYMSPEQATGKSADKRADIWAFGVVLFEMLTGKKLFEGETVTEILAGVIKGEPEWSTLPGNLHPRIRLLLERCLEKIPKNRYSGISDARVDIQKVLTDPGGVFPEPISEVATPMRRRTILPWIALTAILCIIVTGTTVWILKPPEPRHVIRLDYELPEGQQFSNLNERSIAVSPDGKQFVYGTTKGLYLRSVEELTAKLIAGTEEDTTEPFFSPDGKWIGYASWTDHKLKKISVHGGAPVVLCDIAQFSGAHWCEDDTIVFGQIASGPIMRISASGGTPEPLIEAESGALAYPQILPGGDWVLYTALASPTQATLMAQSLKSGETKKLAAGIGARYLPTGHMVYALENNLLAVPFNANRLEMAGGPVPIVEDVFRSFGPQYALSNSGTLVYLPGMGMERAAAVGRTLVWVDKEGNEEAIGITPDQYFVPKISPDGTRVAVAVMKEGKFDIWIWDFTRKTRTRLTFDNSNTVPIWTPDSNRIIYASNREGTFDIYWKATDGTGKEEMLVSTPDWSFLPGSLSPDGKILTLTVAKGLLGPATTHLDIGILPMEDEREWKPLLQEKYLTAQPEISPDGKWMAYASNESGRDEIYIRSFPEVDQGKWQVSTSGGASPRWSASGRELFYLSADNSVMAIEVKTQPTFTLGIPGILFESIYAGQTNTSGIPWDISPDGKRLLMMKEPGSGASAESGIRKINIVLNWDVELKQRVPVD